MAAEDPKQPLLANPQDLADLKWKVDQIVTHYHQGHQLLFKVCWKGFGPEDNTWEPIMHLCNSSEVVQAYLACHPALSVGFHGQKL